MLIGPLLGTPINCKNNLIPCAASSSDFKARNSDEKVLVATLFCHFATRLVATFYLLLLHGPQVMLAAHTHCVSCAGCGEAAAASPSLYSHWNLAH